jgi:two-component system, NarL family, sensor kinase
VTPPGAESGARRRVTDRFAVGAGRITAVLRLPMVAMMAMVGTVVREAQAVPGLYRTVLVLYAVWALGVLWWVFRRPVAGWASWLTTSVDLATLVVLAAASSGPTTYLTPLFYLYPIAVAFHHRPALTATVGVVISAGYAAVWLDNLGVAGGPGLPSVVWLHFVMLLWLAAATTVLTDVLVRRSAGVLELLDVQRQLTAASLATEAEQRARIAEDLHDGALQNLIATRRNLEELADLLPGNALLAQSDVLVRETTASLRGTVSALHPQVLTQLGLAAALAELGLLLGAQGHLTVHTDLSDVGHHGTEDLLYSTARELLANTTKHAGATTVWIALHQRHGRLHLRISDDGTGFDPAGIPRSVATGHIGLASHATRIRSAGGSLTIRSRRPHGTDVSVDLPSSSRDPGDPTALEDTARRTGGPPGRWGPRSAG